MQHLVKSSTCSEHLSLAFSLIIFGIRTSFSTCLRCCSAGSSAISEGGGGLWAARARRGGPGDRGAAWGPVVARRLAAEPRGEGSGSSSPAPALPARAHTSSLTHFAAQAVIWRQRRQPRLPGARFVLEASEPGDGALRRGAKQLAQSFLVDFCFFIVSPNLKTEVLEPWG